jgi:hypothetical protein
MGRPRKKVSELPTEEAIKRLFPREAINAAKEEVRKADEQATKRDSK